MDERNFCISIAGLVFGIHTQYTRAYSLCHDYICDKQPDKDIIISEIDLEAERVAAIEQGALPNMPYLETLAIYRRISEIVLEYDMFLMHGAVIAINDEAYMFTAKSGTGKTTHIRKWLQNLDNAYVVNGDKPLLHIKGNKILACGTPWCGKEQMGTNTIVPLKAIVLMERGENNIIQEIAFSQAFTDALQQTYMPEDSNLARKTLALLCMLKGRVRFYRYIFNNMKVDAFDVAYGMLSRE